MNINANLMLDLCHAFDTFWQDLSSFVKICPILSKTVQHNIYSPKVVMNIDCHKLLISNKLG